MKAPYRDRIDFISSYCDRWCERCAFTTRCSTYAIEAAVAMCDGDVRAGLELALGAPASVTPGVRTRRQEFLDSFDICSPTEEEVAEIRREEEARDERIDAHSLTTASQRFGLLAHTWLRAHADMGSISPRVDAAIEVMRWDYMFIQAKLARALHGLDAGRDHSDDPVQSDWNGSAKVALISIGRSIAAWDAVAEELKDADAAAVASELRSVQAQARSCFPDAWRFRRPGFDDPPARERPGRRR